MKKSCEEGAVDILLRLLDTGGQEGEFLDDWDVNAHALWALRTLCCDDDHRSGVTCVPSGVENRDYLSKDHRNFAKVRAVLLRGVTVLRKQMGSKAGGGEGEEAQGLDDPALSCVKTREEQPNRETRRSGVGWARMEATLLLLKEVSCAEKRSAFTSSCCRTTCCRRSARR